LELIQEFDIVTNEPVNADTELTLNEKGLKLDILKIMITNKLDIANVFEDMVDVIDEFFELQQKEIDELVKLKYHRHKTIFGLYTEKQVY